MTDNIRLIDWTVPSSMMFSMNGGDWLVEFCVDGTIRFNKEAHPKWCEDDFVRAFIKILEECYNVTFNQIKPYPGFEDVWVDK